MAICREISTVIASANPDNNTAMGGHLTQHIYGMTPPPGKSQVGKTLFEARGKFEAVWRQYRYVAAACNCAGNQAQQMVSLDQLGIRFLGAYSCKAADAHGRCTTFDSYMATQVFFGFLRVGQVWILNTAFPLPLS